MRAINALPMLSLVQDSRYLAALLSGEFPCYMHCIVAADLLAFLLDSHRCVADNIHKAQSLVVRVNPFRGEICTLNLDLKLVRIHDMVENMMDRLGSRARTRCCYIMRTGLPTCCTARRA